MQQQGTFNRGHKTTNLRAAMLVVKAIALPRASLLGNPSDLYGGAGVAFTFTGHRVELSLCECAARALPPGLLTATWQVFVAHFGELPERPNFAVIVKSSIPRQVGLAGSSALVIAFLRALCSWYERSLDVTTLAKLALAAEVDVLGIRAGPMDRLAQAHEGLLHMDFAVPFDPQSTTRLPTALLPVLGIAYDPKSFKSSGRVHQPVYQRWLDGDPTVRSVIAEYRPLVLAGMTALRERDGAELQRLMNQNFDLRARLFAINERDRAMIDLGRARGAATKFCGSGGAVLVLPREPSDLPAILREYEALGFRTLVPECRAPSRQKLHLVVLAAGFATRLYPLTKTCSKPLLEVGGLPLLTRIVRQFAATSQVRAITVVHNAKFAADYVRWRAAISVDLPIKLLNNGATEDANGRGAIRDLQLALASAASNVGEGYIVAGGDNVFDFDVDKLIEQFSSGEWPQIVLRDVGEMIPGRYSEAVVDDDGRVTALREKPADVCSPLSAICLYFLPHNLPALVDRYLATGGNSDAPGHFIAWLCQQQPVRGVRFAGRWFDIGSVATLAAARAALG
ncbi:MAG: hypothetical protein EXS02_05475 [Planctomycetes bacterium]|nr:hypothetical protein [Planctomycetota bacterium]